MNDITSITAIVRNLINDNAVEASDIFVASGSSSVFTLTEGNVNSITSVTVNDTESGVTYTSSADLIKHTITSELLIDDVVEITYNCYSNYSSAEITAYIKSALVHLSISNINTYEVNSSTLYPEPCDQEANLIAVIASVLIDPKNISYRMPDVGVVAPKDLNTFDKISKIIASYKRSGNIGELFIAEDNDTKLL